MIARYTIQVAKEVGVTASTINIPINMDFNLVDQSDIIERDFVSKEVEKAINPIIDYEKTRLLPKHDNVKIEEIRYVLNFRSGLNYGNIGFVQEDIQFSRSNFKNSFLNLSFFDNDKPTNQNLLFISTLYTKNTFGSVMTMPVKFIVSDPITNESGMAEGYYIYYYKDLLLPTLPLEIFMEATFNNAKTGSSTKTMTVSASQTITEVIGKIYTKYILKREESGYVYEIDNTYSTNVTYGSNFITVNLYERVVL